MGNNAGRLVRTKLPETPRHPHRHASLTTEPTEHDVASSSTTYIIHLLAQEYIPGRVFTLTKMLKLK